MPWWFGGEEASRLDREIEVVISHMFRGGLSTRLEA